jgi:hypothetical protein
VFLPCFLCWGFWLLLARLYLKITDIAEKITIGRDVRAGVRCGGYLLISGVMVAVLNVGDYISFVGVLRDLLFYSWPVLILCAAAVVVELKLTLFVEGNPKAGDAPAIISWAVVMIYAAAAFALVILFAPPIAWEILDMRRGA